VILTADISAVLSANPSLNIYIYTKLKLKTQPNFMFNLLNNLISRQNFIKQILNLSI
jgi:hypothetical protein